MCEENHRDVTKPKIKGNQTLAEVHLGRFQNRAADGDGGRGVSEWSDADANRKSNLHSGRFQKRSGARLVTKFEPRRNFVGYGRGRGEVVAEEPVSDWETGEADTVNSQTTLPPPAASSNDVVDEWIQNEYHERDPNFMDPELLAKFRLNRRNATEMEAAAMKERVGRLSGTVRVHADSKYPPKKQREQNSRPKTPCYAEPEPVWKPVDRALITQALAVPWGTLGNVRAVPTGAGVSARPGTRNAVVTSAAERWDVLDLDFSKARVSGGDGEAGNAYEKTDCSALRSTEHNKVSTSQPKKPKTVTKSVSYIGKQSHHVEFGNTRGVCAVVKKIKAPAPAKQEELKRNPPPKPAVALHRSYLEIDGLSAYVLLDMRARDEALLPTDRHANAPPRTGAPRRVKYFDHRAGRVRGDLHRNVGENATSDPEQNIANKWTVVEKKAPADLQDLETRAGDVHKYEKTTRPTKPAVRIKGRAALEARKRDFPYGPCTF